MLLTVISIMNRRGRPSAATVEEITSAIMAFKEDIVLDYGKFILH